VEATRASAFEIAKKEYRPYVERGDTIEYTKTGYMGVGTRDYSMATGGYFNGTKLKPNEVVVSFPNGDFYKFTLEEIWKAVKQGQEQLNLF